MMPSTRQYNFFFYSIKKIKYKNFIIVNKKKKKTSRERMRKQKNYFTNTATERFDLVMSCFLCNLLG